MFLVSKPAVSEILRAEDGPVAQVVNPGGRAAVCIVCEHASPRIPASLGDLGLSDVDRLSHAVWDPGAEALARRLSALLDAPLVLSRVSRLVHDCNRPPEAPDACPSRTERIEIPGNRDLSAADRAARVREVYEPFHAEVARALDSYPFPPAFVTIHSFTPVWNGVPRPTEIGLLHDADASLATAMVAEAIPGPRVELNMPYSAADGVTHTLRKHGIARRLPNVMVEVRSDLLADEAGVARVAGAVADMLTKAFARGDAA